jgi:hypothetical protein
MLQPALAGDLVIVFHTLQNWRASTIVMNPTVATNVTAEKFNQNRRRHQRRTRR